MRRILITLPEGRLIRDLFENGFLAMMNERGTSVSVLSPNISDPRMARWHADNVDWHLWHITPMSQWQKRIEHLRKKVGTHLSPRLEHIALKASMHTVLRPESQHLELLKRIKPDLIFATHIHHFDEMPIVSAAQKLGIPSVGLVRSWDNVFKGLHTRTDEVLVWNEINREEVIELERYQPCDVHVVGAPQLDGYFKPSRDITRRELAASLDLNAADPIVTLATAGQYFPKYDETYLAEHLVQLILSGQIHPRTQLVIRLHPWSHYEQFAHLLRHSFVRISFIGHYIPGLSWLMYRDEVEWMGALIRCSDALVTPCSTVLLEAALLDTPVLSPIFHTTMPDAREWYFERYVLSKHFKRILKNGWAIMDETPEAFTLNLQAALRDRSTGQEMRRQLAQAYVPFQDGNSTLRIAQFLTRKISKSSSKTSSQRLS